MKIYQLLALMFCLLTSCVSQDQQPLKFNDRLLSLPNEYNSEQDLTYYAKQSKKKIIVNIESNCSVCVSTLDWWQKFYSTNKGKSDTEIIFILHSGDKYNLDNVLSTIPTFSHPLFYDIDNEFQAINQIENATYKTLIVDSENNIIFAGSPLDFPELENRFVATAF